MTNQAIEKLIQEFAVNIEAAIAEKLTRELHGRVADAISGKGGVIVKVDKRLGNNQKRSRDEIEDTKKRILVALKEEPGQRSEQLQRQLKVKASYISLPLTELLAEKKIKFEGVARGRKYTIR